MTPSKNRTMDEADDMVSSLLDMAAKVEHSSGGFYLQASKSVADEKARSILQRLALVELNHEEFFSDLKLKYQNRIKGHLPNVMRESIFKYAKAVQDSRIFDFDFMLSHKITGREKPRDVIQLAIAFEKDSIVFYSGLATIIDDPELTHLLKEIIREEFSHLSTLSNIDFL